MKETIHIMTPNDESEIVHAYGGSHWSVPYDMAYAMALDAKDVGVTIDIVRVSSDAFELLSLADEYRMDSEYVTLEVGRRLYQEGAYGAMATWENPEDEPKTEEDFARLQREEVYGTYLHPAYNYDE